MRCARTWRRNSGPSLWRRTTTCGMRCSRRATPDDSDGIVPFWVYEGTTNGKLAPARVERIVPTIPMSREETQLERLKQAAASYRMAFGQPRHDDLLEIVADGNSDADDRPQPRWNLPAVIAIGWVSVAMITDQGEGRRLRQQ